MTPLMWWRRPRWEVRVDQLRADPRPGVAVAHVQLDPGPDVVINDPHGRPGDTVPGELAQQLPRDQLAAGREQARALSGALRRAG
jgi:hypothetical protein